MTIPAAPRPSCLHARNGVLKRHGRIRRLLAASAIAILLATGSGAYADDEDRVGTPAYNLADEAYKAYAAGDFQSSAEKAGKAVELAPTVSRWRLLLINALDAAGRLEEAERAITQAMADGIDDPSLSGKRDDIRRRLTQTAPPAQSTVTVTAPAATAPTTAPEPGYAAAAEAYKAFARKDYATAARQARTAVAENPSKVDYRMLLLNALAAQRKLAEAEAVASDILAHNPGDAGALAQRGYLRQQMKRYALAADDLSAALATGRLPADQRRAVRLALADAALDAKQPQRALDALAPLAVEHSYEVAARRGYALQALGRHEEALASFDVAAQRARTAKDKANMSHAAIGELVALGRKAEAKARFAALPPDEFAALPTLDRAYLATQVGDQAAAYTAFQLAESEGSLGRGPALVDAGYAAKRTFHNDEAIQLFKQAIDAHAAGTLPLPAQTAFGLRREVSEMDRMWGAYASVSYGAIGVAPSSPLTPPPSGGHTIQTGGEVYWRPPGIGYRDGAIFEVFGRAFETLYDETDGPTGSETIQGSVGLRWKPIGSQNLVLEISHLFPIGDEARSDWLFRAAYSAGEGSDLRVDVPDWNYWQVYGEGDYFSEIDETLGNFELRWGHSFRLDALSDRLVLTPFLAIGGGYDSALAETGTLGAGPGLNLRSWFREDTYHAPMSYLDLTVQYRAKLAGDERGSGWFAGAFLSY